MKYKTKWLLKRILGWSMLAGVFVTLTIAMVMSVGWVGACAVWGTIVGVIAYFLIMLLAFE